MIKVDLAAFIAFLLSAPIVIVFFLHLLNNKLIISKEKKIKLEKTKCEICGLFSFLKNQTNYWRCPSCSSLNQLNKSLNRKNKGLKSDRG